MIKQLIHKVFSVSLALLVLFSTVSLTVEKHYCGTNLVDVSIFSEVEKCGMEAMEMAQETITKKGCCKDEVDVIEGQNELKVDAFQDLDLNQQLFVAAFAYSYTNLFESLPKQIIPHKEYSPPNLVTDIQLLDDVFLI